MTPVGEILVSLMDDVHSGLGLPELLCQDACRRLPISGAGIVLLDKHGVVQLTMASGASALELEDLQLTLGEGPCIEAFRTGRLVLLPDIEEHGGARWPAYTPAVMAVGVRAVFSYPLRIGGIMLGVLDLYASETGMLENGDLSLALHFADAAVLILLHLQSMDDLQRHGIADPIELDSSLEVAFRTSPAVHQATGMVAIQAGVALGDALLLLRAHAYAQSLPIVEVAGAIVSRDLRLHA